ncbi:MAG: hypothetical protein D3916_09555 [Candidatus Electrothrix sp. MAN1_4]|nr:hypothetical protein [Candidatus Electrothrix sp. MAN1_4]
MRSHVFFCSNAESTLCWQSLQIRWIFDHKGCLQRRNTTLFPGSQAPAWESLFLKLCFPYEAELHGINTQAELGHQQKT